MHWDCQVWAQPGWEGSYRTKTVFYIWQSPRRLGSCGADGCLGCVSYFCPCTVGISLSMPSAGSLIIMHMLMRLQEMSQFAACFASQPAYLLACVGKAACATDAPCSKATAQGSLLLQDRGWEGFFSAQISSDPSHSPPVWKAPQSELS